MPAPRKKQTVLDTSALLALLFDEDGADTVKTALEQASNRKRTVILPAIQYGELLYVTETRYGKKKKDELQRLLGTLPLTCTDITPSHAEVAASFKARGGISYPDCFVLAIALARKATVMTKDKEFRKFEKEVKIEWVV